jgi:2-methylisocitrate lyase-like PEP mutase family enzyme
MSPGIGFDSPRQRERAERLLSLHHQPTPLVLANAWDVASARIFARGGAQAIATTSAGVAATLGYADGQLIDPAEMIQVVGRIAAAVDLPLTADLEAGYGDAPEIAAATARAALQAGAVGLNLEDTTATGEGPLLDVETQAEKIRAIRTVGDELGVRVVINARTDVFLASFGEPPERLEHAVRRVNAYRRAGADCLFVPGVEDPQTIARLAREIDGPLNVLVRAGSPSVTELTELGVARISLGSGPMRATLELTRRIGSELLAHGTYGELERSLSYADLLELFAD